MILGEDVFPMYCGCRDEDEGVQGYTAHGRMPTTCFKEGTELGSGAAPPVVPRAIP